MTNEQLVARIRAGEDEAENMLALWQQNRGFIGKMAMRYQGYAEMDDLKQEGYLGLCEAVHHYKDGSVPFINYAAFWIKQAMRRHIDNCSSTVRIPVYARQWVSKYNKVIREYQKHCGEFPPDPALRYLLGVDQEKLEDIKKYAKTGQIRSLSEVIGGEEDDFTLEDTIASDQDMEEDIIRELDRENMKRELWIAVDQLPGELPEVVRKRYQERITLNDLGKRMGRNISAVSMLENKALRKLRLPGRSRKFRAYYEEYLSASSCRHVGVESFQRTWMSEVEREVLGW